MIVFDLDGTLALDAHRSHLLKQEPKDWDQYFSLCGKDEPHAPIIDLAYALYRRHTLALWSGRSSSTWPITSNWLKDHQLFHIFHWIRLRNSDDRTQDDVLKERWLHEHNAQFPDDPVTLVFEDRARVVEMWRRNGVVCCQVAPGDF